MKVRKIHHVAYRCKDAKETVTFYKEVLNMDLVLAIAEDLVPSTKAPDPYMHIFLDAGQGPGFVVIYTINFQTSFLIHIVRNNTQCYGESWRRSSFVVLGFGKGNFTIII